MTAVGFKLRIELVNTIFALSSEEDGGHVYPLGCTLSGILLVLSRYGTTEPSTDLRTQCIVIYLVMSISTMCLHKNAKSSSWQTSDFNMTRRVGTKPHRSHRVSSDCLPPHMTPAVALVQQRVYLSGYYLDHPLVIARRLIR